MKCDAGKTETQRQMNYACRAMEQAALRHIRANIVAAAYP